MIISRDVTIKTGGGAYLYENGDKLSLICPTIFDAFCDLIQTCEVHTHRPNEILIREGCDVIEIFVDGMGVDILEDTTIYADNYKLMLESGDRILMEQPAVGQSGQIPFKTIASFAKKYGGWSEDEIQDKINDIQDVSDPQHQREMLKQWIWEIQRGDKIQKDKGDKPQDDDGHEVSHDFDEIKDDALVTYAKSPFLLKTQSAANKLISIIRRALTSNRVAPPDMVPVRAEFGAASGKPLYKYVIVYENDPDKTQELMTMGAAAAMAAKGGV
ncbi:MAG: hypothetical protein GF411_08780 [Candidatus Lokiarchaeota archaeon]|nr:hypothetical protein [Candidatus Lokiarchaeota archaeon]